MSALFEHACPTAVLDRRDAGSGASHEALLAEIVTCIERDGAVLVRGIAAGAPGFAALFRALAPRLFIHGGARPGVTEDDAVQLAEIGQAALRVHCEMAYTPLRPDLCGFACEVPPAGGGETLVCDGRAALACLPEDILQALYEQPMVHVRRYARATWQRTFQTDDRARLEAHLVSYPGLRYEMYANGVLETRYHFWALTQRPGPGGWVALANSLSSLADQADGQFPYVTWASGQAIPRRVRAAIVEAFDACTIAHEWQRGDILLLDNWRTLHGRNRFEDPRRRLLAMFGYRGERLTDRTSYGAPT